MKLETEESTIGDATPSDVEQMFTEEFDGFAILSTGPGAYLQTAGAGDGEYRLEYRESGSDTHYEAVGKATRDEVKEAFLDYLRGGTAWKGARDWQVLELSGKSSGCAGVLLFMGVSLVGAAVGIRVLV